ncbi:glycosyltransferase family 2 protein [Brachybacterium sp. UNK5269]|uniref:glycosyltransferase family 2 protein n=1 Tax=Brachybacterium sp. UNK5269 TaxID=3408576 RepID=UPI003BAEE060
MAEGELIGGDTAGALIASAGPTVSVVIDAVGWVEGTLTTIARLARRALGDREGEIIVATGNGVETSDLEEECRRAGIRHAPFDAEHHHAAAMNNAAAAASGEYLVLLEEDFVLAERSIQGALEHLAATGSDLAVLECRDGVLPVGRTIHDLEEVSDRRYFESVPRTTSNRGTVTVVARESFMRIRGYDERPSLEPHLSIDLSVRFARAGLLQDRLSRPQFAAYHFFGASCADTSRHGIESARVRANHHDFVEDDRTIYRNLAAWSVPRGLREVLVSVAISTRNRAQYIADSIDSVLAQTFEDFELIIVDDGSVDTTREAVEAYDDPRVRYVHQESAGISAARNRAADLSRGFFTAVHDDDDIMLPWRLEVSLQHIYDEYGASYGSWVNFNDDNGDMVLHVIRRGFSPELNAFNGQGPGHATWLLPTAAVREVRYDEHLSSSVDHNLASRLAWTGLRWKHTEKVMYLRRIHPTQVSAVDGGRQRTTSVLTRFANRFSTSEPGRRKMVEAGSELTTPVIAEAKDLFKAFGAYLPDHLIKRTLVLANNVTNKVVDLDLYQKVGSVLSETDMHTGKLRLELGELPGITWKDLVTLRTSGIIGTRLEATKRTPEEVEDARAAALTAIAVAAPDLQDGVDAFYAEVPSGSVRARELVFERLEYHAAVLRKKSPTSLWLVAPVDALDDDELAILRGAPRAYEIRASGDHGSRFGLQVFGCDQSTDAIRLISQLPEAIESGRLVIADAEKQPAAYTAQLVQETLRTPQVEAETMEVES